MLVSCVIARTSTVTVTWVKGHAKEIDVARGRTTREDKIGNDGADELAVAGAAAHTVQSEVVEAAAARRRSAMQTHDMMLSIVVARQLEENETCEADRGSEMGDCMELDCMELDAWNSSMMLLTMGRAS